MSAKPFLITGLPRSRTAWMAGFFCTGNVFCLHEPLAKLYDITEAGRVFQSDYHSHAGISDSGAGFFLPWIMENVNPQTLIIERDPDFVAKDLAENGMPVGDNVMPVLMRKLEEFRHHPKVMWVHFDSLGNKRIMEKIWFHLLPGVPFDHERYEQFNDLNIQANIPKVKAYAALNQDRQRHMLRDVFPLLQEN